MPTLPFQPPIEPMLALLRPDIPEGDGWVYEPKWDGFRALVFFDGNEAYLQSRDLKPLARYFPELAASLAEILPAPMVLDGEIVIVTEEGLDFGALQMRIHPAESRVRKLAAETPSYFVAFDMLAHESDDLRDAPFSDRRPRLETATGELAAPAFITPTTDDITIARRWFDEFEGAGLDGIIAKRADEPYKPGVRSMVKIKHRRTADCVVAGLRWYKGSEGKAVGSLLLGLYDVDGVLHHVGHTASFKDAERRKLALDLAPYITEDDGDGFGGGRVPGTPSRWTSGKDPAWVRLRPELVCEVSFDHLQGDRFRHATTFMRWRTDKPPRDCTYDQLETTVPFAVRDIFGPPATSR